MLAESDASIEEKAKVYLKKISHVRVDKLDPHAGSEFFEADDTPPKLRYAYYGSPTPSWSEYFKKEKVKYRKPLLVTNLISITRRFARDIFDPWKEENPSSRRVPITTTKTLARHMYDLKVARDAAEYEAFLDLPWTVLQDLQVDTFKYIESDDTPNELMHLYVDKNEEQVGDEATLVNFVYRTPSTRSRFVEAESKSKRDDWGDYFQQYYMKEGLGKTPTIRDYIRKTNEFGVQYNAYKVRDGRQLPNTFIKERISDVIHRAFERYRLKERQEADAADRERSSSSSRSPSPRRKRSPSSSRSRSPSPKRPRTGDACQCCHGGKHGIASYQDVTSEHFMHVDIQPALPYEGPSRFEAFRRAYAETYPIPRDPWDVARQRMKAPPPVFVATGLPASYLDPGPVEHRKIALAEKYVDRDEIAKREEGRRLRKIRDKQEMLFLKKNGFADDTRKVPLFVASPKPSTIVPPRFTLPIAPRVSSSAAPSSSPPSSPPPSPPASPPPSSSSSSPSSSPRASSAPVVSTPPLQVVSMTPAVSIPPRPVKPLICFVLDDDKNDYPIVEQFGSKYEFEWQIVPTHELWRHPEDFEQKFICRVFMANPHSNFKDFETKFLAIVDEMGFDNSLLLVCIKKTEADSELMVQIEKDMANARVLLKGDGTRFRRMSIWTYGDGKKFDDLDANAKDLLTLIGNLKKYRESTPTAPKAPAAPVLHPTSSSPKALVIRPKSSPSSPPSNTRTASPRASTPSSPPSNTRSASPRASTPSSAAPATPTAPVIRPTTSPAIPTITVGPMTPASPRASTSNLTSSPAPTKKTPTVPASATLPRPALTVVPAGPAGPAGPAVTKDSPPKLTKIAFVMDFPKVDRFLIDQALHDPRLATLAIQILSPDELNKKKAGLFLDGSIICRVRFPTNRIDHAFIPDFLNLARTFGNDRVVLIFATESNMAYVVRKGQMEEMEKGAQYQDASGVTYNRVVEWTYTANVKSDPDRILDDIPGSVTRLVDTIEALSKAGPPPTAPTAVVSVAPASSRASNPNLTSSPAPTVPASATLPRSALTVVPAGPAGPAVTKDSPLVMFIFDTDADYPLITQLNMKPGMPAYVTGLTNDLDAIQERFKGRNNVFVCRVIMATARSEEFARRNFSTIVARFGERNSLLIVYLNSADYSSNLTVQGYKDSLAKSAVFVGRYGKTVNRTLIWQYTVSDKKNPEPAKSVQELAEVVNSLYADPPMSPSK